MNLDLKNKNALVSGSSAGIGKATALQLAKMGANVTLIARNEEKLQDVLAELSSSKGQKHSYLVADFTDPEKLLEVITEAVKDTKFHILINNTGGPKGGRAAQASPEEYLNAFSQHLVCNQILVKAISPGMAEEKHGRIINVISTSVKQPIDGLGVSNTIRGAVANWSKTLANELGQFGITVNNVLPGFTKTDRLDDILSNASKRFMGSKDKAAEFMQSVVPLKRFAEPSEIANAIAFLASDAAGYISGINLPVDGGRTKSL